MAWGYQTAQWILYPRNPWRNVWSQVGPSGRTTWILNQSNYNTACDHYRNQNRDHVCQKQGAATTSALLRLRKIFSTSKSLAYPRLSPQEVTNVLRQNEFSMEFSGSSSVKSYDSNQLQSNNPIEDTRSEARCLLTTGTLLGVFDGHGGGSCAQVISKRLFKYIAASLLPPELLASCSSGQASELIETFNDNVEFVDELRDLYHASFRSYLEEMTAESTSGAHVPGEFSMQAALERAFLRMDTDLSSEAESSPSGKTLAVAASGAVACVAHVDGPHLHVASTGDCQAVLGSLSELNRWTATKLTMEHNSDNSTELERVLGEHPSNERETVVRMDRLLGQLAPLRAFGDFKYKWNKQQIMKLLVPLVGEQTALPPNYYTPPYLTAKPEVRHHRLTPRDKFLVIASDGLWDLISPLQVVRLIGEHMSGKVTLHPFRLPRRNMRLGDIEQLLIQRREGLKMKPLDTNAATHLIRNALGGTEYGVDHGKLSQLLSMPDDMVRVFRDDITVTVVYFDSDFLRHCPP